MILLALTIFVSAFLLFLVQPIIAKEILPWFGGSAAVWSTCLVFFQIVLLAGYFYSDWTTRRLTVRRQAILHLVLIALALLLLPIAPSLHWRPTGDEQPALRILLLLTATIGLPYFILSTTSPLVQAWFALAHPGANPYRLFALSNLASMLALIGYPFLVEPNLALRYQATLWSMGFGFFAMLIALAMWRTLCIQAMDAKPVAAERAVETLPFESAPPSPTRLQKMIWVTLAALGSSLLLGVSNHLTQNISSIPLLWVLPLAIYLLTFILAFNRKTNAIRWYSRFIAYPITAIAICAMAWLLADKRLDFMLYMHIAVFSVGLFVTCMYCHGELANRKPAPQHLTSFYLMISIGGALGSFLIGVLAPVLLSAYYELGFTLYALALVATGLLWRQVPRVWNVVGVAICVFTLCASLYAMHEFGKEVVVMTRNFYGTLRVKEYAPSSEESTKRFLLHGAILHGDQFIDNDRRREPSTYYKTTSGIGIAILQKQKEADHPARVGIVGLGAGTLAAYGRKDDAFRFYELNPAVVDIAQRDFFYLRDTEADVEIAMGDARLSLEREESQHFDVLAIDAFSSDSIPVHLITIEALAIYEKHMQPDGIIAFHVSNRFLQLHPVVEKIAQARGLNVAWIEEVRADGVTVSDWILLSKDKNILLKHEYFSATQPIPAKPNWRMWTDDFNNLVQILK